MISIRNFKNIFLVPELRKKLFFTLGVLVVERLGTYIPAIGINIPLVAQYMKQSAGLGGLLSYLDIFSGGSLGQCTLFALGIGPYITASIMIQMLGMTMPSLEALMKEGEYGRKILNQYTRYLTLILAVMYSFMYAVALEKSGLVLYPGWAFRFVFILSLSAAAMFVMWLGEQISLYGLGNGSSMIIFAGIVAKFPDNVLKTIHYVQSGYLDPIIAILIWSIFVLVSACIVFLEKGERKIPVQYARRIIGQRVYGGQSTYIPFKINTAGVMPVIFASSFLSIPIAIAGLLSTRFTFLRSVSEILSRNGLLFNVLQFVLIIFFTFFYTALIFNPEELAENIRKSGGFIPGIRPGKKTAEFFNYLLTRIGLVGSIYLAILAAIPNFLQAIFNMPFYLGGTSLLIAVGVAMETSAQIESYLLEHKYEGFLTTGRLTGRGTR